MTKKDIIAMLFFLFLGVFVCIDTQAPVIESESSVKTPLVEIPEEGLEEVFEEEIFLATQEELDVAV